jgi:hypothetical protein
MSVVFLLGGLNEVLRKWGEDDRRTKRRPSSDSM